MICSHFSSSEKSCIIFRLFLLKGRGLISFKWFYQELTMLLHVVFCADISCSLYTRLFLLFIRFVIHCLSFSYYSPVFLFSHPCIEFSQNNERIMLTFPGRLFLFCHRTHFSLLQVLSLMFAFMSVMLTISSSSS